MGRMYQLKLDATDPLKGVLKVVFVFVKFWKTSFVTCSCKCV
jgi:hypothetical protein